MSVFDGLAPFLYRRLGRWITCEFRSPDQSRIRLRTKYDAASFGEVFCHPFYWQVYSLLTAAPALVVDCGANCGHFSILAHRCIQAKFHNARPEYLLVEPNPSLLPIINRNLAEAGVQNVRIEQGLLGPREGEATLWIQPKTFMASGMTKVSGAKPYVAKFLDLDKIVGDRPVGLMKLDIEGGEFDFIKFQAPLFERVGVLVMELHGQMEEKHHQLLKTLKDAGLRMLGEPIPMHGEQLLAFAR